MEAGSPSDAGAHARRGAAPFFFLLRTLADRRVLELDSRKPSLLRMDRGESVARFPVLVLVLVLILSDADAPGACEADREWTADGEGLALSGSDSGGGE